jgi:hypothetical protein
MPYRDLGKHVVHEVRRGLRQLFDIPMEARMRAITHLCPVPFTGFQWVQVEVGLIADEMFPKSMLP